MSPLLLKFGMIAFEAFFQKSVNQIFDTFALCGKIEFQNGQLPKKYIMAIWQNLFPLLLKMVRFLRKVRTIALNAFLHKTADRNFVIFFQICDFHSKMSKSLSICKILDNFLTFTPSIRQKKKDGRKSFQRNV